MAAPRRVIEIPIGITERIEPEAIARSRTEWAWRAQRARILLAYHADPSTYAVGESVGATHQTVQRCLDRAVRFGVMAALDDSPRPGKEPTITDGAKAWVVSLACQKPKKLRCPHELWTTRLLARHVRERAEAAGHPCLTQRAQGTVCKILDKHDLRPHTVRYYLERRDHAFEQKMAEGCAYIARSLCCARAKLASRTLRPSPMTRSRASRQSAAVPPTCRHRLGLTADGHATMNTSAMAR